MCLLVDEMQAYQISFHFEMVLIKDFLASIYFKGYMIIIRFGENLSKKIKKFNF